jgi:type IV secretory pathway component VirB8
MSPTPPKNLETAKRTHPNVKDYLEISEKVRTGEYFREARKMYDLSIHDPMAERYMYVFITVLAIVILLVALGAAQGLYPLKSEVPLIFDTVDPVEDIPRIQGLLYSKDDDPGEAMLRFIVKHYVEVREGYDIATFDRNVNSVKSQSSEEVFREYQSQIDPRNPDSPIAQYQRHSKRKISIVSSRRLSESMEVLFEAVVESRVDIKKSYWRANIAFKYSGVELDEKTGKVKPVIFVVTKYHSKRLQDAK